MILESNISKYNFKVDPVLTQTRYAQLQEQANGRKLILIPGQVEDDASILRGCGKLNTLEQLIEKVRFD
ncbi:hypothetical protein, partial [Vibrio vulnificus]|uniref:hypothetical protein n=1 Tax=Vibrio vulnificus TaxID=672 RepID=UPI0039B555A9